MKLPITHVEPLLPHSGDMVLVDEILQYDEESLTALAHIRHDHVFVRDGQLPMYIAIEIMAQCVAAWAGCHATDRGEPIQLGFLLGSRKYEQLCDALRAECTLKLAIRLSMQDNSGFGVFNATLHWHSGEKPANCPADNLLAKATLSVFSPKNSDELVRKMA